jgi:hypothetical protein
MIYASLEPTLMSKFPCIPISGDSTISPLRNKTEKSLNKAWHLRIRGE